MQPINLVREAIATAHQLRGFIDPQAMNAQERIHELIGKLEELEVMLKPNTVAMKIIAMTRDETKNSQSPFWRCATLDGKMVNVFQHEDELKDTFHLFAEAGFGEWMTLMQLGQSINWVLDPVQVKCIANGNFWNVVEVKPMERDQHPDPEEPTPDW